MNLWKWSLVVEVFYGIVQNPLKSEVYLVFKVYLNKNWPAFIHFVLFHTI